MQDPPQDNPCATNIIPPYYYIPANQYSLHMTRGKDEELRTYPADVREAEPRCSRNVCCVMSCLAGILIGVGLMMLLVYLCLMMPVCTARVFPHT